MTSLNVQLFVGGANLPGAGCKVIAHWMPLLTAEPEPIQNITRDPQSGVRITSNEFQPASTVDASHGGWSTNRYLVPNETYIKIWMHKREGVQAIYRQAQFVVRIREGAAYNRVRFLLPAIPASAVTAGYMEGNFDMIKTKELIEAGFDFLGNRPHFDVSHAMYEVQEIRPASIAKAKPTVTAQVAVGNKKVGVTRKVRRIL